MIKDIQNEIVKLKKEKNITILAHSYQTPDILEIADIIGDSFMLSKKAQQDKNPVCIVCGVHFMAETVKILSPEKKVILANPLAGCPMAEQFTPDFIEDFKNKHPEYAVVAYVNTTAALKTVSDACVTSSSAVSICSKLDNDKILFIPDCNLGSYVAEKLPDKEIKLMNGGCPLHSSVTAEEVLEAKKLHPDALVLTHPECRSEVVKLSDFIGSTADIMKFAEKSEHREFIIGTEISIAEHLSNKCPEKSFYILSKKLICPDMKITTLTDILRSIKGEGGLEIVLDEKTIQKARGSIDKMIELG